MHMDGTKEMLRRRKARLRTAGEIDAGGLCPPGNGNRKAKLLTDRSGPSPGESYGRI